MHRNTSFQEPDIVEGCIHESGPTILYPMVGAQFYLCKLPQTVNISTRCIRAYYFHSNHSTLVPCTSLPPHLHYTQLTQTVGVGRARGLQRYTPSPLAGNYSRRQLAAILKWEERKKSALHVEEVHATAELVGRACELRKGQWLRGTPSGSHPTGWIL